MESLKTCPFTALKHKIKLQESQQLKFEDFIKNEKKLIQSVEIQDLALDKFLAKCPVLEKTNLNYGSNNEYIASGCPMKSK